VVVRPIRIVLEVERLEETLSGSASADDGPNHEFSGWLG
jgi:hypothetical protein